MGSNVKSIMRIEVPLVVVLGERPMDMAGVRQWVPGSIIELPINAEEDLEIRINNRQIASGSAVKIEAMGPGNTAGGDSGGGDDEMSPDDIAAMLLSGQI
jgi:hypothetical protein